MAEKDDAVDQLLDNGAFATRAEAERFLAETKNTPEPKMTKCWHCAQEIRLIDGEWIDCETHSDCDCRVQGKHVPAPKPSVTTDPWKAVDAHRAFILMTTERQAVYDLCAEVDAARVADRQQHRDALAVQAQEWVNWTPTPDNVNKLPDALRSYVHQLETECDPAGDTQARILAEDTCRAQEREIAILQQTLTAREQETKRIVKLGVIEFHPQDALRKRFYAVTNDLAAAGCIVDLWLMDIATVLREFGYEMTITFAYA